MMRTKNQTQENSLTNQTLIGLLLSIIVFIGSLFFLILVFSRQWQKIKTDISPIASISQIDSDSAGNHENLISHEKSATSSSSFLGDLFRAISTATLEAQIATETAIDSTLD